MFQRIKQQLRASVLGFVVSGALVSAASVSVAFAEEGSVSDAIKNALPHVPIASVQAMPVPGIYQVVTEGGEIFYVDEKAKHAFTGDLLAIQGPGKFVSLSEKVRREQRAKIAQKHAKIIQDVDRATTVTFSAEGEKKGEIFVFTDTDCGYCRKLHIEVPALTKMGIDVHYLAWPRAGVNSDTGKDMSNIWCAKDQLGAMDLAKQGQQVPDQEQCDTPIQAHLDLGVKLGVRGTPAIFLNDGRQVGGYKPAKEIAADLGL